MTSLSPAGSTPNQRLFHFAGLSTCSIWLFFFALFFTVAFGSDSADGATADWQISAISNLMNRLALPVGALVPICFIGLLLNTRTKRVRRSGLLALFLILMAVELVRSGFEGTLLPLKILVSMITLVVTYICVSVGSESLGGKQVRQLILSAGLIFGALLIIVNLYIMLSGGGINPNTKRFFGTSSIPNFLGAQLSLAIALLVPAAMQAGSVFRRIICAAVALIGIYELYATGTRTALLMAVVAVLVYLLLKRKVFSATLLSLVVLGAVAAIVLVVSDTDVSAAFSGAAFDRGGVNTRSEAIEDLAARVEEHPYLGAGQVEGFTANSYLRGWATYGIAFPVLFVVLIGCCLLRYVRLRADDQLTHDSAVIFSILMSLLVGGLFEGFLVDARSLPIVAFTLTLILLDRLAYEARAWQRLRTRYEGARSLARRELPKALT
jgi:hypothetical protein